MGVTTVSAAVHIIPVVIKTFAAHGKRKAKKFRDSEEDTEPKDDIFYDEAFNIVKSFIELGTKNTIESLQGFTNTHVPAPYWAAVSPVRIPLSTCNRAADHLIDWFGPDDLKRVVGGERWWQVRGLDGIDAEWITETDYLNNITPEHPDRKLTEYEKDILKMDHLDTVMLYVHGGGFFWGSINTHRYQIIRYARKIKGRAFAVNYRKAPQYPWPCPLQDVLASYLYLIDPPSSALHKPVHPSKIVFAGDSAGGNLCLSTLILLRDLGLPMPAGAVLISPWVDLTHSFPSVMNNTGTDIIPPYGFLAKPSATWPIDLLPPEGGRVAQASSNPPPKPGFPDTLKPSLHRVEKDEKQESEGECSVRNQEEMLRKSPVSSTGFGDGPDKTDSSSSESSQEKNETRDSEKTEEWEPKPPKVRMCNPEATPLELRSQIQLYATTEQLIHPLVSPVLQSSLGNLPPLYILAGSGEVLRDEIIYLAHRAAYPNEYPTRSGILRDFSRQKENAERFTTPTKVHLQVFDGMCHVLTVFSFVNNVKYAYRSIAEFVKHVTSNDQGHVSRNPFPELHRAPSQLSSDDEYDNRKPKKRPSRFKFSTTTLKPKPPTEDNAITHNGSDVQLYKAAAAEAAKEVATGNVETSSATSSGSVKNADFSLKEDVIMIRERVDIHARIRPMEPRSEIPALQVRPEEVGLIKEAPTMRWLHGQEIWDKEFKQSTEKAIKKRKKIEEKAKKLLEHAREQGFALAHEPTPSKEGYLRNASQEMSHSAEFRDGTIQKDRRWGPLDLDNENPPPTSIAKRRDTPEALALLKKSIYHTAPVTHKTVPKLKPSDAVRAAFDPHDDPNRPPKQSVSEQQVKTHIIPIHGLNIWDAIVGYFMRESTKRAADGTKKVLRSTGETLGLKKKESNSIPGEPTESSQQPSNGQ